MSAREPSGSLPWSGSRARSRERGYGDAMRDVWDLARKLEGGPMPAAEALAALGSWAYDAWLIAEYPSVGVHEMQGLVGGWQHKPAPGDPSEIGGGGAR